MANAELALRADDEQIAADRSQALASREDALRLTQLRFDAGAAAELDLRSAESLVAGARVDAGRAAAPARAGPATRWCCCWAGPLPADLPPPRPLDERRAAGAAAPACPPRCCCSRPDVRQAEQPLIAANANIGAARAAFFPRITLTGSVGTASTELSGLFEQHAPGAFAPQLLQPHLRRRPQPGQPGGGARPAATIARGAATRRRSRPPSARWPTRWPARATLGAQLRGAAGAGRGRGAARSCWSNGSAPAARPACSTGWTPSATQLLARAWRWCRSSWPSGRTRCSSTGRWAAEHR
ncbi:MAG: TolC family protein [Comamonadaceae bacterium]|nr:TolC family protein [Comamonadaceae bacterium]